MSLYPPEPGLRVSVVVPAKDEEELVGRCLRSLAAQTGVSPEEYEVLLVLDHCADATEDRALEAASEHPELRLTLLEGPGIGAGHARRVGMEAACERLISLGRPEALIASTDADTVVSSNWLARQLAAADRGARAIGGRIELAREGETLPDGVRSWRDRRGRARHLGLLESGEGSRAEHWQFSGASMSLTAEAYREVGGLEPRAALEDEYLEHALERCDIPIERPLDVRVVTSPRLVGRASRGLAKDLSLASWLESNTYREVPEAAELLADAGISVIASRNASESGSPPALPGANVILAPPRRFGAPLTDAFGPVRGRGDALWRGLSEAGGDIVVLLPDLSRESLSTVPALVAPLLEREDLELVKGYPAEGAPSEASRLMGAPLINLHHPELAGFVDPLSPFVAARRELLAALPFPVGAGIEASLLLDTARVRGVWVTAQTALQVLPEPVSAEDAHALMAVFLSRAHHETETIPSPAPLVIPDPIATGFDTRRVQVEERPPLRSLEIADSERK